MKLDLKEWLAKVTGQTEFKTLLWTNPSPTANFAPQTILNNGELNGYDAVEIVANPFQSLDNLYKTWCPVGAGGTLAYCYYNTGTASNASTFMNGVTRDFSVSANGGIVFQNGNMTYNGGAYVGWQARAIPYKVYGIKYVG